MLFEPFQRVTVACPFFGGRWESCNSVFSGGVSSGTLEFVFSCGCFRRNRVVILIMEGDIFAGFFGKLFLLFPFVGVNFQLNVKDK